MIIHNAKLYTDVRSIPAWNYFHFQMYSQLFEACSHFLMGNIYAHNNEIITRLRYISESGEWKDDIDNLITHIENSKVAYHNSLEGLSHFYLAFGCIIQKTKVANIWQDSNVDLIDEEALMNLSFSINGLSALQIVEEVRKVNDILKEQLSTYFPDLFPDNDTDANSDFQTIKNGILSIDLESDPETENAQHTFWEVEKHFLEKLKSIPINQNDPKYFGTAYINTFTEFTEALELKESDLKEMSIYSLFIRQQYKERKNKKLADGKENI